MTNSKNHNIETKSVQANNVSDLIKVSTVALGYLGGSRLPKWPEIQSAVFGAAVRSNSLIVPVIEAYSTTGNHLSLGVVETPLAPIATPLFQTLSELGAALTIDKQLLKVRTTMFDRLVPLVKERTGDSNLMESLESDFESLYEAYLSDFSDLDGTRAQEVSLQLSVNAQVSSQQSKLAVFALMISSYLLVEKRLKIYDASLLSIVTVLRNSGAGITDDLYTLARTIGTRKTAVTSALEVAFQVIQAYSKVRSERITQENQERRRNKADKTSAKVVSEVTAATAADILNALSDIL